MAKAKRSDSLIVLKCSVCKRRNYYTHKNKKSVERKVELKKYCPWCKVSTIHKEGKISGK
jgi:large subunit ribosomal protein L33